MPFTPAHPAIVLPFLKIKRNRVSATALVMGSVAPDFEYFFKMSVSSQYSHTLLGIFYFDIPVTIVLAFLFHDVVKINLIANLPAFLQFRFTEILHFDFKNYFKTHYWVVIISSGIGSFSHLFWDSFTHNDGFFAQRISVYKYVVVPYDGVRYPLFYGLQHISTMIGLTLVLLYVFFSKVDKSIKPVTPLLGYWTLILFIWVAVIFFRFAFDRDGLNLGNFVVSSISAMMLATLAGGIIKFEKIGTIKR